MTTQVQHKKTGLWLPENSGSENAIREAYFLKDYGGLPPKVSFEGKVLMDCGAHIGAFSARAILEGAKFCHCYEPMPPSAESIDLNLPEDSHKTTVAALSVEEGSTEFHFREDRLISGSLIHKGANHKRWNYTTVPVKILSFAEELEKVKPDIIKMDVEGTEWDILTDPLPDHVETLFIEVHKLYAKGAQAGYDFIESVFPGSKRLHSEEMMAFKAKGKVTELTAVYTRV